MRIAVATGQAKFEPRALGRFGGEVDGFGGVLEARRIVLGAQLPGAQRSKTGKGRQQSRPRSSRLVASADLVPERVHGIECGLLGAQSLLG